MDKRINYRKLAFEKYSAVCALCGFGIKDVLEVCHLDCDRTNNNVDNLTILCPNCHKMHDLDLIPTEIFRTMRDRPKCVRWKKRMKDAGQKAKESRIRRQRALRRKNHLRAIKAVETRNRNKAKGTTPGRKQPT